MDTYTCKWSYSNCISAFEHASAASALVHMNINNIEVVLYYYILYMEQIHRFCIHAKLLTYHDSNVSCKQSTHLVNGVLKMISVVLFLIFIAYQFPFMLICFYVLFSDQRRTKVPGSQQMFAEQVYFFMILFSWPFTEHKKQSFRRRKNV